MDATPDPKRGGMATAALILALVATLALMGGLATAYHAATSHAPDTQLLASIGMMLLGGAVLDLIALVLAIIALRNSRANHRIAATAAALAATGLVITVLVVTLGLANRH